MDRLLDPAEAIIARARAEAPQQFAAAVAVRIEREVFERTRWVPVTSAVAGLLVAAVLYGHAESGWLLLWVTVMLAAAGTRMVFNRKVIAGRAAPSSRVHRVTVVAAALSGAFWGSAPWLPLVQPDPVLTFFLVSVVAGIIAGAAVSYATAPRIMLAVALPAIPPTVLAVLLRGDSFGFGAAALLLALGGMVVREAASNRRALEAQIAHAVLLERSRQEVQGRETLLRIGADALPELIAYVDARRRVQFANRRYIERHGMSRDKLIGTPLKQLYPIDHAIILPHLEAAFAGSAQDFDFVPGDRGRHGSACRMRFIPDLTDDGRVRGVFSITIEGEAASSLRSEQARQAFEEVNGTLLDEAVFRRRATLQHEQLRRSGGEHALCLVELDVTVPGATANTPQSRAQAMRQVAAALRHTVRSTDLIGQVREDEFAMLFVDCPQAAALGRCQQMIDELKGRSFEQGGETVGLRAAVGVTALRGMDQNLDGALSRAAIATEIARRSGGNRVIQR